MTRTPMSTVTATTIAACAFAWGIPGSAHLSGLSTENSPLSSLLG